MMKKILLSLFVGLIGLINFGYCEKITPNIYQNVSSSSSITSSCNGFCCFWLNASNITYRSSVKVNYGNLSTSFNDGNIENIICIAYEGNFTVTNSTTVAMRVGFYDLTSKLPSSSCPTCPDCPTCDDPYTSLECQQEYNLIPLSSVDQNYCVNNGLCPSSDCPVCPGSGDNWSALYINDIQHLGKPIINITFPDYLDWDYTTNENEFNLDIVGYPVDTEYIDGIIRTQNYKPTSEDFTQLVGMLAPYSKYLLFLLFVFIIWAWIKKPFKSKKL